MKCRLTKDDYDAFADLRSEVLRTELAARAEERAKHGGPELTEMSLGGINDWLQEFHAEARQLVQRSAKAGP